MKNRKSLRLRSYDYSREGGYFITVTAAKGEGLFGEIKEDLVILNRFGKIVESCWMAIPEHFENVILDEFILMPNHLHGIFFLSSNRPVTRKFSEEKGEYDLKRKSESGAVSGSIGAIIGSFKSASAKQINAYRASPGSPVWQRNYYDHVIRSDESLNKIREYIRANPTRWAMKAAHPEMRQPKNKGLFEGDPVGSPLQLN